MSGTYLKEGYLIKSPDAVKHLHNTKKWNRKWFTLDSSGELLSYDSEKSSKISGSILPIPTCTLIFDPKIKGIHFGFCIGLEFRDLSILYLKAESAQIFNDWLRMLQRFADKCELEELPERHSTVTSSDQLMVGGGGAGRSGSVSSMQSRHLRGSVKSRFDKKEGIMSKTGSNNKGWKERYFILNNGKLSYYKNDKSLQTALGSIDLFECSSVTLAAGKKGFGLDLHTPSRVFNLSTETEVELNDWLSAFTHTIRVIADIKDSPTGGVPSVPEVDRRSLDSDRSLEKSAGDEEKVTSSELALNYCIGAPDSKSVVTEDKDGLLPLLEAEVDALRGKVSSLEADLRSSTSVNGKLQRQLVEERNKGDQELKSLRLDQQDLQAQVQQLEKMKEDLEAVNDSIQTQLDGEQEKNQILEENVMALRHELDEQQLANTNLEEDLSDTQAKLHEIQMVAQELEQSLRSRSESEPPDPSGIRSLNLSYQAKMEEGKKRHSADSPGLPRHDMLDDEPITEKMSNELVALKEKVSSLEKERESLLPLKDKINSLERQQGKLADMKEEMSTLEKEKESLHQQLEDLQSSSSGNGTAMNQPSPSKPAASSTSQEEEERLKWQVEMSNIRRELEGRLEAGRRQWEEERLTLRQEVGRLKEELSGTRESSHQLEAVHTQLDKANQRVSQLEGEVQTTSERVSQLLIEKEKALADLNIIRKANRSIEKRLSESEDLRRTSSPLLSVSPKSSSPLPATEEVARALENERKLGDPRHQMDSLRKERDALKAELDSLKANRISAGSSYSPQLSFGKGGPTLGTSNQSAGRSIQAPPTSIGVVENQPTLNSSDLPPPKPKKPSKELMNRLNQSSSSSPGTPRSSSLKLNNSNSDERTEEGSPESSIRSRTATMLQVIFARR